MSTIDEVGLGKQLQSARKAAGLTQQQLCNKARLSYSTLAKIERGAIKTPSVFTIISIADTIGVSLDELLGREAATPVPDEPKKTSRNGVKFVYFDINGCLVRFFHRAFTKIAEETGASPDKIESSFWHYNDLVCKGEMTVADFNKAWAKDIDAKDIDWMSHYLDEVDPIPEMHELVTWASEHYYVGLLSNIMPGFIKEMIKRGLVPDVAYSAIVDSSEVGAIKPEELIYEIAQTMADHDPEEILLVDDDRTNLMAAQRMGWHVLWFDDFRPAESSKKVRSALEFAG
jgi:FMN phosphatase YigB (HAD superfamily)/DNA-binding XRE family transcriptional regulator